MRNFFKTFVAMRSIAIIAMVAVIGFGVVACDGDDNGGDTPTGGKSAGGTVNAPTLLSKTDTSISITAPSAPSTGQAIEYGINTTNAAPSTWQDGLTFSSLTAGTPYYIFARAKENATHNAGTPSTALQVTTDASGKAAGGTVDAPTFVSKTANSITITAPSAPSTGQTIEYGINTTDIAPSSWQDGLTFDSLTANTPYYIFARAKENTTHNAGTPSTALPVTTDPLPFDSNAGAANIVRIGPGGGIIYYYDEDGFEVEGYGNPGDPGYFATYTAHYLEVAQSNSSNSAQWGACNVSSGTLISGVTTTTSVNDAIARIGNGRKDTQIIVAHLGTTESERAAQLCAAETFGGQTDWFLPSLGEFYLYRQSTLTYLPTDEFFWSSSQNTDTMAWRIYFADGTASFYTRKSNTQNVRAVRAF